LSLYPTYQKWLEDSGLTQIKGRKPKKIWEFDGQNCPKCQRSQVWDNRERIRSGEFSRKSPHFACRDKTCGWAVWGGGYKITTPAEEAKEVFGQEKTA